MTGREDTNTVTVHSAAPVGRGGLFAQVLRQARPGTVGHCVLRASMTVYLPCWYHCRTTLDFGNSVCSDTILLVIIIVCSNSTTLLSTQDQTPRTIVRLLL